MQKDIQNKIEQLWEERDEKKKGVKTFDLEFYDWLKESTPTFNWDWIHLQYIQKYINKILDKKINRLMIFCPPRHGKSEMTTIRFPIYWLCRNPTHRIIVGAYNQTLADKFSRSSRRIGREYLKLNQERTAVQDWETIQGGGYRAVGVGGGITGQGGHLIVIDDPVKSREEANSPTYRDKVWDWFRDDLYTRLEPDGAMILIMTRWHESDLAGRILESDFADDWNIINLPALAEDNDVLGRSVGDALCPDRFPRKTLLKIKNVIGYNFEALYQQRPSIQEGQIIPVKDLVDYEELPKFDFILQSWDTAFKTKQENDFSVGTTWGVTSTGYYLIDRYKNKVMFPDLKQEVKRLAYQYNPNIILIEDRASGQSLIQELRCDSKLPISAVKVDTDKGSRANACTPTIASGSVFIPKRASWRNDLIHNLAVFPNGMYDDDVDSVTMALNYLTKRFSNSFSIYPEYNDLIHTHEIDLKEFNIVSAFIGIYVERYCSAVIVGVTEFNQMIILKEFINESGLDSLLINHVLLYLERFDNFTPLFNLKLDRKDIGWMDICDGHLLDYQNLSKIESNELIENVKECLTKLDMGLPTLVLSKDECPVLREGFRGGYNYKPRSDRADIDFQDKPIKNRYSRLHIALQLAVYSFKTYTYNQKHPDTIMPDELDYYEDDKSQVGGY